MQVAQPDSPSTARARAGRLLREAVGRRTRSIMTPEGVVLPVEIADYGERLTAFAIDFMLCLGVTMALLVAVRIIGSELHLVVQLGTFLLFVVRNLYFLWFELRWHGLTPGKRVIALKVIDRRGVPLTAAAVVARNLMREIELFFPLELLAVHQAPTIGASAWEVVPVAVWLLLAVIFPFSNRDRMRAGDLVAGTMVIALPRRLMLADLSRHQAAFSFSPAQLGAYGIRELYLLEDLLRRPDGAEMAALRADVCARIRRKIDWREPIPAERVTAFLTDFYTAQRAHLEALRLRGRTRRDKHQAVEET